MSLSKSYSELIKLKTFEERFNYLKLEGNVAEDTFGIMRWINQELYHSPEWKSFRDQMIIRDNGCDLGIEGRELFSRIILHHINPLTCDDLVNNSKCIFDPENVICVSHNTHNAIHYSDESILQKDPIDRKPNDTCPWKVN